MVGLALWASRIKLNETTDSYLTSSPTHRLTGSRFTVLRMIIVFFPHVLARGGGGLEKGWALRSSGEVWRGGAGRLSTASTGSKPMPITIDIPYRIYERRLREGRLQLEDQPCPQ